MEPTEFSTAILKGSYKRATLTGAIIIKVRGRKCGSGAPLRRCYFGGGPEFISPCGAQVAGGNEEGDDVEVVDDDDEEEAGNEKCVMESVDLEALEKGEIEEVRTPCHPVFSLAHNIMASAARLSESVARDSRRTLFVP